MQNAIKPGCNAVFDHGEITESTEQPFDECRAFLPAYRSPSLLRSLLQTTKKHSKLKFFEVPVIRPKTQHIRGTVVGREYTLARL